MLEMQEWDRKTPEVKEEVDWHWLRFLDAWLQDGWLDLRFQYGKEGKIYQLKGTVNGQSKSKQVSGKYEKQGKLWQSVVSRRNKAKSGSLW